MCWYRLEKAPHFSRRSKAQNSLPVHNPAPTKTLVTLSFTHGSNIDPFSNLRLFGTDDIDKAIGEFLFANMEVAVDIG